MKKVETSSSFVDSSRSGYVYIISAAGTDNFKIGMTKQPILNRLNALQTGCPLRLRYVYHSYVEEM